jgi:hypothetical protein
VCKFDFDVSTLIIQLRSTTWLGAKHGCTAMPFLIMVSDGVEESGIRILGPDDLDQKLGRNAARFTGLMHDFSPVTSHSGFLALPHPPTFVLCMDDLSSLNVT